MRPQGWESLLAGHIAAARDREFAWGEHDCVLWCADWVRTLTGTDPASRWRGTYSTEAEAQTVLRALGLSAWADLGDVYLPETPVPQARRGDVLLHPAGMLGICDGAHGYFLSARGVTRIEFLKCLKAWKVE